MCMAMSAVRSAFLRIHCVRHAVAGQPGYGDAFVIVRVFLFCQACDRTIRKLLLFLTMTQSFFFTDDVLSWCCMLCGSNTILHYTQVPNAVDNMLPTTAPAVSVGLYSNRDFRKGIDVISPLYTRCACHKMDLCTTNTTEHTETVPEETAPVYVMHDSGLPRCALPSDCQPTDQPRYAHFRGLRLLSSKPAPLIKSGIEIGRILFEYTSQASEDAPLISVIIPTSNEGHVRFVDVTTGQEIVQFSLSQVRGCAKGSSEVTNRSVLLTHIESEENRSLGKTINNEQVALAESETTASSSTVTVQSPQSKDHLYRTHIVRCRTTYEASRLLYFMGELLNRRDGKKIRPFSPEHGTVRLRIFLDLREEEKSGENEWKSVPKEKSEVFKLRAKTGKRLLVGFSQISGLAQIFIESCLNISVAYGRYLNESELTSLGPGEDDTSEHRGEAASNLIPGSTFVINVPWPTDNKEFEMFDTVTGKDECIFFTVSVQLRLANLEQPVGLNRVCRARVFRPDEVFWLMADRKPVMQDYAIYLNEVSLV
ncbi:hypothetical protein AHF37_07547 [Paragonimus kellicotti]|nr:hypothetical protein AHF37_07547 [Paragonimus kellicotti]